MSETTDKTISDTNSEVPRVIKRGKITTNTATSISGGRYRLTNSVTFADIKSVANPIIDCFYYQSGGGTSILSRMNSIQLAAYGTTSKAFNYYLDTTTANGETVVRLNIDIVTDSSTPIDVYFIVYSASMGEGLL